MYLDDFKKYLLNTAKIKPEILPYYLKRINAVIAYYNKSFGEGISNEEKSRFLDEISNTYEEWQIKQADYAIKLYNFYINDQNRTKNIKENSILWEKRFEQLKNTLRLKQRAYNTEKTYIYWLNYFKNFLNNMEPDKLTFESLQDFLTFLAVEKKNFPKQFFWQWFLY